MAKSVEGGGGGARQGFRFALATFLLSACGATVPVPAQGPEPATSKAAGPERVPDAPASEPSASAPPTPTDFVRLSDTWGILSHPDSKAVPGCSYETSVPELVGLPNKAHERMLNARLEQLALEDLPGFCDQAPRPPESSDWSLSRSYAVQTVRSALVSLRFDEVSYSGGAHDSHRAACYLLDTNSGSVFGVGEGLSDASLQRLSELYNQLKRADPDVQALESTGAQTADLVVTPRSTLCVKESGLELQTADYELGAYAFGSPSFTLSAEQVRPLFEARLGAQLFPR